MGCCTSKIKIKNQGGGFAGRPTKQQSSIDLKNQQIQLQGIPYYQPVGQNSNIGLNNKKDQFVISEGKQSVRKESNYSFHFLPNKPKSLTMTKNPAQLTHLLVTLPIYILISDQDIQAQQIDRISKDFPSKFVYFKQISILKKFLLQQKCQNVRLLCPLGFSTEIQTSFGDQEKVKKIYCYGQCQIYKQVKEQGSLGNKFGNCASNLDELTKLLIQNTEKDYLKNEYFNFIDIIGGDAAKSNTQVSTMYAMLNQETNEAQLIDEMIELARLTGFKKEKDFDEFRKDLLVGQPNLGKIVEWYTKDSFVYRLVNSLLGTAEHPSEMYCLQPYIKRLFRAIHEMHKEQQFTCFRGAFLSQTELYRMKSKNGLVLQNLSYMSTSLDPEVAQRFASNALFIIHVASNQQQHNGFASVGKHSVFKDQAEVLFNPLNFFQVIGSYEKQIDGKKITVFELTFAPISKDLSVLKKYQQKMSSFRFFGHILVNRKRNMEGYEQYLSKHAELCITKDDVKENMLMRGISSINAARFQNALQIFQQRDKLDYNTEQEKAEVLIKIGSIYSRMGQFQKSLEYLNKCQEISRKSLGISHPEYAEILNNIGDVYSKMGQFQKSLEYFNKCQEISRKSLGISHPDQAAILNSIGSIYSRMGQFQKSLEYLNKCQEISRKSLGISHPDYAAILNNIGSIYSKMGQFQKSLEYLNKCQELSRKSLWISHPDYVAILNNIGDVYSKMGQFQKSFEYYNKCQQIYRKSQWISHPEYAAILNNIGSIFVGMGQFSKSLQYLNKCQEIKRKSFGISHPEYATILSNIGFVYSRMGQFSKSLQYFNKCQELSRKSLGISHPDYATILSNIGIVYSMMGQFQKSLEYYNKCQEIKRKSLGISHPDYATILSNIGFVYSRMGQFSKSLEYLNKSQEIRRKSLGISHPSYLALINLIGQVYYLLEQNPTSKLFSENDKALKHSKY